jgi:hypothetical protein
MGEVIAKAIGAFARGCSRGRSCVWEERAPEFESIVTQWVGGGFHLSADDR